MGRSARGTTRAGRTTTRQAPEAQPADRPPSTWDRIYAVVRRIPKGRVATYGQIAALAGMPRAARQVGYALHALPDDSRVPWQRVINARGEVSPRAFRGVEAFQRSLLEQEGVVFGANDRVDLAHHGWRPRARRAKGSVSRSTASAARSAVRTTRKGAK